MKEEILNESAFVQLIIYFIHAVNLLSFYSMTLLLRRKRVDYFSKMLR